MRIELKNNILQLRGISFMDTDAVFAYLHTTKKKHYECYQINRASINNRIIHGNHMLQEQDTICILLAMEEDTIEPWYGDLEILFEDELFCVVDKPVNLPVHSNGVEYAHAVCNLVKTHCLLEGRNTCVHPPHHLDYETSGAMIFCKIPFLQPPLDATLENEQIYREYEASARGYIVQKHCAIARRIARGRHDAREMRMSKHGKDARTDVSAKQNFMDFTWIRC